MNKMILAALSALILTLAACNTNPNPVTPPVPPSPPTPPPLTTPVGTNVGSPVTQTIGSSGGTINGGGVKLEVLPGTVSSASVSLQPITDTLNGSGQGVAISSDAAWSKYAKITFPIDPSEDSPEGLGLAVQQADGSWLSLDPVKVDTSAGTVTAGLPASVGTSGLRAQAGLQLRSVVKFKRFYLKPSSATVKVKKTKTFVPYAQVIQNEKKDPNCGVSDPVDDLAPVCQFKKVTREYPFTNDKPGFFRYWYVNGLNGGNSTVGTISASGAIGATYTAPSKKPSPDTVTVKFKSIDSDAENDVEIEAKVKITAPAYRVSGSAAGGSLSGVACDTSEPFSLNITYGGGSTTANFQPSSDTDGSWSGNGSVTGGATVAFNGSYTISGDPASSDNALLQLTGTGVVTSPEGSISVPMNGSFNMTAIPPC